MSDLNLVALGTSGLKQSGGYIYEEFLRKLQGLRGVEFFKEFTENNPQAGAIKIVVRSLIRQAEWKVKEATKPSNYDEAKKSAELLKESMHDMEESWDDFISEALSCLEYGWALFEPLYKIRRGPSDVPIVNSKYDDGFIAWRSFPLRSQDSLERWEYDRDTGKLLGMWQMDTYLGKRVFIPIDKAMHFRATKFKNNPEGTSFYRNGAVSYMRLKNLDDIESIGAEREMTGTMVMEVPPQLLASSASASDKSIRASLERMLGAFKRNEREFVLMPSEVNNEGKPTQYRLRLMASPGTRSIDITKLKDSHKVDILQSCLTQFLQLGLGAGAVGSFSLASSSTNLLSLAIGAVIQNLKETINKQAVAPMMKHNRFKPENCAELEVGDIETPSLAELGAYLKTLFDVGAFNPTEKMTQHLYNQAKLPVEAVGPEVKGADELIQAALNGGDLSFLNGGQGEEEEAPPAVVQPQQPAVGKPQPISGGFMNTPAELKTSDQLINEVMPPK